MIQQIDYNFNLHANRVPDSTSGMKVSYNENFSYVDSGLSCDTFNILHIYNAENISSKDFEVAINHFRSNRLEFCLWVNRENLSEKVKDLIKNQGLDQTNAETGMVLDLEKYEIHNPHSENSITEISSSSQLEEYARVLASNWAPPDANVIKYYEKTESSYLDHASGIRLMICHVQGTPAGTVELFPTNPQIIGIYGLATLESHRGKGVGTSLMTRALNYAKENGYSHVILQATEQGISIYEKLGFRAYTEYYEFT